MQLTLPEIGASPLDPVWEATAQGCAQALRRLGPSSLDVLHAVACRSGRAAAAQTWGLFLDRIGWLLLHCPACGGSGTADYAAAPCDRCGGTGAP